MNRRQLEHVIRAAADIADDDEIIVIGSQSVLAQYPDAPPELLVSNEADVFPRNHPERWDVIDGSIGEGSPFHTTFGYYAQGVEEGTAILPDGWRERLAPIRNANTRGATGLCLDIHDLAIAKFAAGREKDKLFLEAAVAHGLLRVETLRERLAVTRLTDEQRGRVAAEIEGTFLSR